MIWVNILNSTLTAKEVLHTNKMMTVTNIITINIEIILLKELICKLFLSNWSQQISNWQYSLTIHIILLCQLFKINNNPFCQALILIKIQTFHLHRKDLKVKIEEIREQLRHTHWKSQIRKEQLNRLQTIKCK